ncbi:MAG: YtxH domain-containing protein [Cyclobacteriaceae bacterium]
MRLLTVLVVGAIAGILAINLNAPEKRAKTRIRFNKESGKFRSDMEKTVNEAIYSLLNNLGDVIDEYAKRSQKSIKQAKKKKSYVHF